MKSPLPFAPVVPRLGAWLAVTPLVIHSFVNVGSPTTLSSPVYGGICALSLVTGIWPSWPENLASASPRARFYDGSYVTSQSSRNAGKPMSVRSAIPGAWTLTYLKVGGQWMYLYRAVEKQGKTVESYLESNA